ncbi:hypothetical protein JOM56_014531, partial [Amanita muscaria]
IKEFVDHIDELLQATLSWESLPAEQQTCSQCPQHNHAKWRCIDCTLARPVCRQCMHNAHRNSPLHRIEYWTRTHFRPAELWETNVMNTEAGAGADYTPDIPMADALNNTYVRIVHTNGIHHLAMVTCHCQGAHQVPLDLVAHNLIPASFIRIRTLFSAHVLNYFRLCNLELKAPAYQFYQLIRRLTNPIGPAKVVNLYHEFRRMSRLW